MEGLNGSFDKTEFDLASAENTTIENAPTDTTGFGISGGAITKDQKIGTITVKITSDTSDTTMVKNLEDLRGVFENGGKAKLNSDLNGAYEMLTVSSGKDLDAMKVMNAKVAFLPLGGIKAGWEQEPELRTRVVKRLKEVGDMAASEGLVIGIETQLDAKGDVRLLKEIDSPGIKIYFKFQNVLENGRDLCKELKILGKKRICQIHCTDTDGVTLPFNERLDIKKVKNTLDKMGWSGWLVVERSRDKDDVHNVRKNYGTNVRYLKEVFQK